MAVTGPSSKMKRRMMVCMAVLCLAGSMGLIARLFSLQVVDAKQYQREAAKQQLRVTDINPKRGIIYDRNMKELAKSATVHTVVISPLEIEDEKDSDGNMVRSADQQREVLADGLARILEVDREKIITQSHKENYYEIIKRRVERDLANEVLAFAEENDITCIHLVEDNKRYYPYGSLASTVLGFTNSENQGAYGLEAKYDEVLSGTPGREVAAKNAWGTDMPFKYGAMYPATDGNSIVLTIDETIQHFTEKYLEIAVKENNVHARASCIVMDPNTGEILAMATENDFDPNNPYEITDPFSLVQLEEGKKTLTKEEYADLQMQLQYDQWRNKAISDPYEPGSVFKLITAAAALEEGTTNVKAQFNCPGYIMVGSQRYNCWATDGRHGQQDFAHIVMNSCNPGFVTVGLGLGGEKFFKYYQSFGFTERTGIDLPGEASNASLFHGLKTLTDGGSTDIELASESFGQTHKVTPIQLITGISAVINGGNLMQPHVVKQIVDANGNIVENIPPTVKRQVISTETSKTVALLAERVVSEGSGKNAYLPGFRVGGKTGTSEKIDKQEDGQVKKYISSFLGYAPADNPQVVCLLMMDEPYMANPYGSMFAAPVVGAILSETLPYLGVEPKYTEKELANIDVKVPNVLGKGALDAGGTIRAAGLEYEVIGEGTTVIKQTPRGMTSMPKGGTILLYTDTSSINELSTVPNLIGMTAQQADVALNAAGLNSKLTGAAGGANTATKQSEEPGTQVEPGTVITVTFISKDTAD